MNQSKRGRRASGERGRRASGERRQASSIEPGGNPQRASRDLQRASREVRGRRASGEAPRDGVGLAELGGGGSRSGGRPTGGYFKRVIGEMEGFKDVWEDTVKKAMGDQYFMVGHVIARMHGSP